MSDGSGQYESERKFLHAIASPLTRARLHVSKAITEIKTEAGMPALEKTVTRLEKAIEALNEMEGLHADHKALLQRLESAQKSS